MKILKNKRLLYGAVGIAVGVAIIIFILFFYKPPELLAPNPAGSVQYYCPGGYAAPSGVVKADGYYQISTIPCTFTANNDGYAQAQPGWNERFGINGVSALWSRNGVGYNGNFADCPTPGVACMRTVNFSSMPNKCKFTGSVGGGLCISGTCSEGCGLRSECPYTACNSWSGTAYGHVEGDLCVFDPSIQYKFHPGTNCNGEIPGNWPIGAPPNIGGTIEYYYEACIPNWSCSNWGLCNCQGTQTRTCQDSNNCGVSTNKPTESQTCTYTSQWTCGNFWGCGCNLLQNRTCTDQCAKTKTEEQSCQYNPVWNYGNWTKCGCNNKQTRIDIDQCQNVKSEEQNCVYTSQWTCSYNWSACVNGKMTRSCTDQCGGIKIDEQPCCNPNWTCGEWGNCVNGNQTRACTDGCNNSNVQTQNCYDNLNIIIIAISAAVGASVIIILKKMGKF